MQCIIKGNQPSQFTNTVSVSGLFTLILLARFLDAIDVLRIINFVRLNLPSFIAGVDILWCAL